MLPAEHVQDRFGESAGEVDLGDLGAALLADAGFRLLVAVAVDACGAGVGGGLDERPAQKLGPLFGERAAQVAFARLVNRCRRASLPATFVHAGSGCGPFRQRGWSRRDETDRSAV